jgi:hypothetical protein
LTLRLNIIWHQDNNIIWSQNTISFDIKTWYYFASWHISFGIIKAQYLSFDTKTQYHLTSRQQYYLVSKHNIIWYKDMILFCIMTQYHLHNIIWHQEYKTTYITLQKAWKIITIDMGNDGRRWLNSWDTILYEMEINGDKICKIYNQLLKRLLPCQTFISRPVLPTR